MAHSTVLRVLSVETGSAIIHMHIAHQAFCSLFDKLSV